jgi:hypothetical protein
MGAFVDLKTGRIFPPPYHGPGRSYFHVPWAFPMEPPLSFRLDSRLLIAKICESTTTVHVDGQLGYESHRCGPHYFVMGDDGLTLIYRVLDEDY